MNVLKRSSIAFLALASALATAQNRQTVPIDLGRVQTIQPDYVAMIDAKGNRVTPWQAVSPGIGVEVPAWLMAFDSMSTNTTSFNSYSSFYGAHTTPRHFGLAKKTFMAANDMNVRTSTIGGIAKRVRCGMVWQPSGGPQNLVIKFYTSKTCDIDPAAEGPAIGTKYSGIIIKKLAQAPSAQLVVDADLGNLAGGVPIPRVQGGGVITEFGTTDANGDFAEIPLGTWAAQPLLSNMNSPSEPYFPGSNPSSSGEYDWEDDTQNSPSIPQPNYFFEDYTNTTANGFFPYAEQYSNNTGSVAAGGILQPSTALFVDTNMRTISGTLTFSNYVSFGPLPVTAVVSVYEQSTGALLQAMEVPLSPTKGYLVPDPKPNTGGTYKVTVKVTHWLAKATSNVVTTGGNTVVNVTLPVNGDITNDNIIDIADYTQLATAFDKSASDFDWLIANEEGYRPFDSDINGDSIIDVADYSILASGFDGVGD
ncbi:MAG: hypothetical protein JNJ45_06365 [Chthonomonas sp.]|nr:hypothetical protein [Chthonomonas sp.]